MPTPSLNHIVWIVLDSARYDAVVAAATPNLDRLGAIQRRYSYASWTFPSHLTMFMGLLPHARPAGAFAAVEYRANFEAWGARIGAPLAFEDLMPGLNLPTLLGRMDYRTTGFVSLPVLNPFTVASRGFDRYELWPRHDDFAGMIDALEFPAGPSGQPQFVFLNLGETHYPYRLYDAGLPRLPGAHGVVREMAAEADPDEHGAGRTPADHGGPTFFDAATLARLRQAQIDAIAHIDTLLPRLYDRCPPNTHLIVTADHGELFGEAGFFGHGPTTHEKVFEVPFVEGRVPIGATPAALARPS